MSIIRPEILAFMQAAEDLMKRSNNGQLLSDEEADQLSGYLSKLEEMLRLDG